MNKISRLKINPFESVQWSPARLHPAESRTQRTSGRMGYDRVLVSHKFAKPAQGKNFLTVLMSFPRPNNNDDIGGAAVAR